MTQRLCERFVANFPTLMLMKRLAHVETLLKRSQWNTR
ncbi:Uncharacterised protein [Klebsiella pneumoniae]|nr:Uncharacterised protein [Klebsiella pneumoniae]SYQ87204.1 Uncharacterised protein [Klebsiella pneumoniae]